MKRSDHVYFLKFSVHHLPRTNIMLGELLTSFLLTAIYLHSLADSQGAKYVVSCCCRADVGSGTHRWIMEVG